MRVRSGIVQILRAGILAFLAALTLSARAQNVIQIENAKTAGVTTQWRIPDASYASNQEIEGYASATSVNRGESINLYIQTKAADATYSINIYRIGWYGGAGGRLIAGPITRTRTAQPACPMTDTATRLVECNWTNPYVLSIPDNTTDPSDWASGVYLAKLTGGSTGKESYIIFVVRDDARPSGAMFQTAVTTYAAYNNWGGYDFYDTDSIGLTPANKVSFNRPYKNSQRHLNGKGAGDFLSWEINMLRFVEREGFDVTYATNIDTHTAPSQLLNHRTFMSVGHDEYYTKQMYDAVEAARNAGVNLAFFGANNIYWQIRLEPSALTGQPNRTVVGYKYDPDPIEGTNPTLATYTWRETSRAPIDRPEAALIGVMYDFNTVDLNMVIADCSSWVCAGTNLQPGDVLPGMLGYEVDRIAPSSPVGITAITSSPYDACLDPNCTSTERRFANATYYTAASGAGVFATGSMQWNWGVDSFTPGAPAGRDDEHNDRSNAAVQQITRNVLTRFTSSGTNTSPQFTSTPVTFATVAVAYSYDVNATDANGDVLTYSLLQAPTGMTINALTGLIIWTPSSAQIGGQAIIVRVTDPGGLFATQPFTINVSAANIAPQITSTPVTIATVGAAYSYDVNATDANGDVLTYSLTQSPAGMTINANTGLIAWTPTSAQAGNQAVTVRATDPGGLFATQSFTIAVAIGAIPTTTRVDLATPAAYSATRGTTVAITLNWYRVRMSADLLQFMHLVSSTGQISSVDDHWTTSATWTAGPFSETRSIAVPPTLAAGTYDIRVGLSGGNPWTDKVLIMGAGVSDPENDQRYKVGTITVTLTGTNTAPQITSTPVTTAAVGVAYSYDVNATDANGDVLSYSLTAAPAGMTINGTNGLIAWTPTSAQVGSQAVTVRATDPGGLFATQSFSITVAGANVAPQITSTPVTTATVGVAYSYDVNATDANGDVLSYSLTAALA
ncbi:MAG: N,N-dimethylformamidase beta subunit family domain-containing protein, partial [Burkholderiales bacterium]